MTMLPIETQNCFSVKRSIIYLDKLNNSLLLQKRGLFYYWEIKFRIRSIIWFLSRIHKQFFLS